MTTQETYTAKQGEIAELIKTIQAGLKIHAKDFKNDPENFGYAADLEFVKNSLADAVDFLRNSGTDF